MKKTLNHHLMGD